MDYSRARDTLKLHLQDYVESITQKSKGANMYVCPICGSGTGANHTGAFSIDKDRTRWKCFSCGKSGDIFDLIGEVEHITEPVAQLKRAGELYGVQIEDQNQNQPKNEQYTHTDVCIHTNTYTHTDTDNTDYSDYFRECNTHLQETDYLAKRGITEGIANLFTLGYDEHYTKSTGGKVWKALIIPTGAHSYVARNTDPDADSKNRYRKCGEAVPLNCRALEKATKPIFITEGELDALSIMEAGGEAIGLGSTANIDKFIENYVKGVDVAQPLILVLDNDEAGRKAEDELSEKLRALSIANYRLDIYGDHKDANEALTADKEDFTQQVAQAVSYAREQEEEAKQEYKTETNALSHLQEFIDGIKESANTPATPTGFQTLDEMLDGGLYEGLYIVGAVSSLGKTTWTLQIADQIAESGKDVIIFSLEMARSELMSKSISRQTLKEALHTDGDIRNAKTNRGITTWARYENYSNAEKLIINSAINAYGKYAGHLYIYEGLGDLSTDFIRRAIEKHIKLTKQAPVVLIDYIQIIAPPESKHSLTDKQVVDKNVTELKRISRDYKIPVIGISSFNRDNYTEPVNLASFKESGAIEYSSDVLIGLQYDGMDYKDGESDTTRRKRVRSLITQAKTEGNEGRAQRIEVKILKNRNGRTGSTLLGYYPLFNYFQDAPEEYQH